jgi:hypothetical protein
LLRVLQEREFQRLGGTRVLHADVRVVAATNRDLRKAIERGAFREDSYYRLNVFELTLPALRDRRDDVLRLSEAFLDEIGRNLGRPSSGISRDARQALANYDWPGNVRELRNVLERAAILADGGLFASEHLSLRPIPRVTATEPTGTPVSVGSPDLSSVERTLIERAVHAARFNKSQAAKAGAYAEGGSCPLAGVPLAFRRSRKAVAMAQRSIEIQRFAPGWEGRIPRYAYLPFGGGPRVCIGNGFAMMEARLVLSTVAARYRLQLESDQRVAPMQLVTLRPRNDIRMKLCKGSPA